VEGEAAAHYSSYSGFLKQDPRRRAARVLEIGHDWQDDEQRRFRVCYYTATGELTAERLSGPLDLEDFERGVEGVAIVAVIPSHDELERRLGTWPMVERCQPRTLTRLRELVRDSAP